MKNRLFALAAGLSFSIVANAALEPRLDGQAVYDTEQNVTWLADANLAASNTFGVWGAEDNYGTWFLSPDGSMAWSVAQRWISAMNASNYLGFSDWRLPSTLQPDVTCSSQTYGDSHGTNCAGSEMGHLFYEELGGVAGHSINMTHNGNYGLFQNIQSNAYWSGTGYWIVSEKWAFHFDQGIQSTEFVGTGLYSVYAWAIRDGDVAAVPEANTWVMFLAGLSLVCLRRLGSIGSSTACAQTLR